MMEENLTKEAKEKRILFDTKKDEFFRMLKEDTPLDEITKVIEARIG
jgi:hypothetical protein